MPFLYLGASKVPLSVLHGDALVRFGAVRSLFAGKVAFDHGRGCVGPSGSAAHTSDPCGTARSEGDRVVPAHVAAQQKERAGSDKGPSSPDKGRQDLDRSSPAGQQGIGHHRKTDFVRYVPTQKVIFQLSRSLFLLFWAHNLQNFAFLF